MDGLTMTVMVSVIGVLGTVSGALLGWLGFSRTKKRETREEAARDTIVRADMDYIKRGVDDIKLEQRAQRNDLNELTERVIRVEESNKQAHKRIDGFGK